MTTGDLDWHKAEARRQCAEELREYVSNPDRSRDDTWRDDLWELADSWGPA